MKQDGQCMFNITFWHEGNKGTADHNSDLQLLNTKYTTCSSLTRPSSGSNNYNNILRKLCDLRIHSKNEMED